MFDWKPHTEDDDRLTGFFRTATHAEVPFYPDALLVRLREDHYHVVDERANACLAEGAQAIHDFNRRNKPILNLETALPYLTFFNFFASPEPRFLIPSKAEVLPSSLHGLFFRATVRREGDKFRCAAPVIYGGGMFMGEYEIRPNGEIEMLADEVFVDHGLDYLKLDLPEL